MFAVIKDYREKLFGKGFSQTLFKNFYNGFFGKKTGAVVLVLWFTFLLSCRVKSNAPNILFVTIDTLRPDRVGCYGYKAARTPNIDDVATEGVLFENARTAVPLTLPSHATMFTGLYPTATGVRDNLYYSLPDSSVTLAEVLAESGYATSGVIGAYVLHSKFGLAQGFSYYNDHLGGAGEESVVGYPERNAQETADIAIEWVKNNSKKKFFLWVHFFDPHTPYSPPEPYASEFADKYDGEIAYTDYHLGRLLAEIKKADLDYNTAIIIVGDHGESLGEHGESTHGVLTYDSTLRVPLIVKAPKWHRGKRVSEVVSLVDIFPTLMNFAGIKNSNVSVHGIDLSVFGGIKEKGEDGKNARDAVYFESRNGYNEYGWVPLRGLVVGRYKYIEAPTRELYDVEKDPHELHNLANDEREIADKLANRLSILVKAITSKSAISGRVAVSESDVAKLRSLGYISAPPQGNDADFPLDLPDPKDKIHIAEMIQNAMKELEKERPEKVVAMLTGLGKEKGNSRIYLLLGEAYEALGDDTKAEENYRRAIHIKPSDPFVLSRLGWTFLKLGKVDEAEDIFNLRAKYYPFDPLKLKHSAYILLVRGKYQESADKFKEFIKLYDADSFTHLGLAMAFQHLGVYDDAIKEYRLALNLDPKLKPAMLNLALLLVSLKRHGEAKPYLERFLEFEPQNANAMSALGEVYLNSGALHSAMEMFKKALQSDPFELRALENLTLIYIVKGSPQSSFYEKRYFESARKKNISRQEQERVRMEFHKARQSLK